MQSRIIPNLFSSLLSFSLLVSFGPPAFSQSLNEQREQLSALIKNWDQAQVVRSAADEAMEAFESKDIVDKGDADKWLELAAQSDEAQAEMDAFRLDIIRTADELCQTSGFNSKKKLKEVKPSYDVEGMKKFAEYLKKQSTQYVDKALMRQVEAIEGQIKHSSWLRINRLQKLGKSYISRGQPRLSLQANLAIRKMGNIDVGYIRNFEPCSTVYDVGISYFHSGEMKRAEEIARMPPNLVNDKNKMSLVIAKRAMLNSLVAESKGDYNNAIKHARECLDANAVFIYPAGICYGVMARCCAKAKQPEQAKANLELAKMLSAFDAELDYTRDVIVAEVEYLLGDFDNSLKTLNTHPPSTAAYFRYSGAKAYLLRSLINTKQKNLQAAESDLNNCKSWLDELPTLNELATQASNELSDATRVRFPLSTPVREKFALIVGVGQFQDPTIPKLRYCTKDATAMRDMLVSDYGFKPENVRLLIDAQATKKAMLDSLRDEWLPKNARSDDLVFVFLSSHGTPAYKDVEAKNYVVFHDTNKKLLFSSSLAMDQICKLLRSRCKARKFLVVADTCYSGGLALEGESQVNLNPDEYVVANSMLVVSSSDVNQKSWESKRYENGVFTRQLIDSFKRNRQFKDFNQVFREVHDKTAQEVKEDDNSEQTPRVGGIWNASDVAVQASSQ